MNYRELDFEIKEILQLFCRLFNFKSAELITINSGKVELNKCVSIKNMPLETEVIEILKRVRLVQRGIDVPEELSHVFENLDADVLVTLPEIKKCFGVLAIKRRKVLNEAEIETSKIIAGYISNMIDKFTLIEDLKNYSIGIERLLMELSAIHEISHAFGSGKNLQVLLEFIMEKCMSLMNAEAASLMLIVEEDNELEFKVALGPKGKQVKPFRLPLGKGVAGWVAVTREPVLIANAYEDPRFDPSFDKKSGFVTRSILCVPMFYHDKTIGVMQILNRKDGKKFSEEDKMIFTIFATQAALSIENARLVNDAIEKERMEKELEVAAEIQQLLIPKKLPEIPSTDIVARNIPCKQVGGDFYDIRKLDEHRYLIIIADVSGKGVPASLVVSTMQASLKAYLSYTEDLVELTNYLNQLIVDQTTSDRYITFFISIFDTDSNNMSYVNAGHNPPFLFRNNEVLRLKGGGIPLGFMQFKYEKQTIQFEEGDLLLLYTDGLEETMNPEGEEYGESRVVDYFHHQNGHPANELMNKLITEVSNFRKGQVLEDDLTMIIMRI